mmetsp:Transcript_13753/g.24670  ORF Transcript_13753/g.24670 Transcript_13753/m.24670 type:complete len:221 (-) Transcript_13753:375-1037(-)
MDKLEGIQKYYDLIEQGSCYDAILGALSNPNIYFYGEFLTFPSIQNMKSSPNSIQLYNTLVLFTYGTYSEYISDTSRYITFTDELHLKLRKLSLLSIAAKYAELKYSVVQNELYLESIRSVEDLMIECIYDGMLKGRLNQKLMLFKIEFVAGRDLKSRELMTLKDEVNAWKNEVQFVLDSIDKQCVLLMEQEQVLIDDLKAEKSKQTTMKQQLLRNAQRK